MSIAAVVLLAVAAVVAAARLVWGAHRARSVLRAPTQYEIDQAIAAALPLFPNECRVAFRVPPGCLYVPPRRILRRGCWVYIYDPDGERVTDQRVESSDEFSATFEDGTTWSVSPTGQLHGRGPLAGWVAVGRREEN